MSDRKISVTSYDPRTGAATAREQTQHDYIEPGSLEHAAMLGLRKATKEDEYQDRGYTFLDIGQYFAGPNTRLEYVRALLAQKVNDLTTRPTVPTNAPGPWLP